MAHHTLDVKKLICPMPVIRVSECIENLSPGDILTVIATDKGVIYDIPAWCRIHGHTIVKTNEFNKEIHIDIEIM